MFPSLKNDGLNAGATHSSMPKDSPRKRATLTQIAAKAGTSAATVSYVLNEKGAVGTETRTRVLSAARTLGYQIKRRAPQLATGEKGLRSVTLLWVNTSPRWQQSWLSNRLSHAIATSLQAIGGRLHTLFITESEHSGPIITGDEDALLIAGRPSADFCRKLPAGILRLNIMCQAYPTSTSFLDIDHFTTGHTLTRHLIVCGHRNIGFVSNARDHRAFGQRYIGYTQALDEAHLSLNPDWVLRLDGAPNFSVETSEPIETLDAHLTRLFKSIGTPCALVAANDWIAGAIYQHALRNGLRIPEDVSVVGCDDDPSICNLLHPGLTTHTTPYEEVGREAVHWLRAAMAGNPPHLNPGTMLLPGKLVVRQSCGSGL